MIGELVPWDGHALIVALRAYVRESGHRKVECQSFWGRTMVAWCLWRSSDMSSSVGFGRLADNGIVSWWAVWGLCLWSVCRFAKIRR